MPTVGYQGFKSLYKPAATSIPHRKDPAFNINPLKPKLKDGNVQDQQEYQALTNGMKLAMSSTKNREAEGLPDN